MSRTLGILCLVVGWCFLANSLMQADTTKRPNVVFLLADDQPANTIRAYGNSVIETPHLDRLAERGIRFTRATCANPICTPSRAEILTGCSGCTRQSSQPG